MTNNIICESCKTRGETNVMVEEDDMLICKTCFTSIILTEKSPLSRYIKTWNESAEEIFPLLRPPLSRGDIPITTLFNLYEDCYFTLLIGKPNGAIVLMGVLLEALMKERIRLEMGYEFQKPYGPCLKEIKDKKLMKYDDIRFLETFKDNIRNPYQHSDEKEIMKGIYAKVWPITFEQPFDLKKFEETITEIKSGKVQPKYVPVEDIPMLRAPLKMDMDKKRAIELFNQVYDFFITANVKYFNDDEYQKHHKKFGSDLEKIH